MNSDSDLQNLLDELADLCGIFSEYHDVFGEPHALSRQTRDGLLAAMGLPVEDAGAVAAEVSRRRDAPWTEMLPPTVLLLEGEDGVPLALPASRDAAALGYRITTEEGEVLDGGVEAAWLDKRDSRQVAGVEHVRYWLHMPGLPGFGYHRLAILPAQGEEPVAEAYLIIAPRRCHCPDAVQGEDRVWGVAAQLYSVRTGRDWGMGDFSDLAALVEACPGWGAQVVGLNPLHALFPHNPDHDSPYCPSSRLFFNYLYIDLEAVPELEACADARAEMQSPDFVEGMARARRRDVVKYRAVAKLKRPLLERLFKYLKSTRDGASAGRWGEFQRYLESRGEDLRLHALYEALQEHLYAGDRDLWGWPVWPDQYKRPDAPAVAAFAAENAGRVEFFCYLQWLAEEQLAKVAGRARELGLPLGLYLDLSVSVDSAGAEVWANQEMYAPAASVGAPPDALGPMGQDWGLPPLVPERLTESGYGPFISTLRQNMRHAGALRIDHAMQLMRLFWIPRGEGAAEGAYVRYPLRDLLGVLALESVRNQCMVIGEDLGTVPDEVRHHLSQAGVLSYRLLYFERREGGDFKRPDEYPRQALVTVTTHDLPTLGAWWEGYDNDLRQELGLFPSQELLDEHRAMREQERRWLLGALAEQGLLPDGTPDDPSDLPHLPPELGRAMQVYLARTPSQLMVAQLEDLMGQVSQANMPSTTHQHPNWKQKLRLTLEELAADPEAAATCRALQKERG